MMPSEKAVAASALASFCSVFYTPGTRVDANQTLCMVNSMLVEGGLHVEPFLQVEEGAVDVQPFQAAHRHRPPLWIAGVRCARGICRRCRRGNWVKRANR